MLTRQPVTTTRTRYTVRRPQWPTTVVREATYVVVTSISGAGGITLLLRWKGLV